MFITELNHLNCKTYLVASESARKAALIDPLKQRIERYLAFLAYRGWELDLIVDTHTHADHLSGAHEMSELTGARVAMHRKSPAPHVRIHVKDGDTLRVGELEMKVLHTPGHTPDSISLCVGGRVMTGDVLLIHGSGRTDFAGGDAGAEFDSITAKLFALPEDTIVLPGHDYRGHTRSTIGEEKRSNPRLTGRSREQYIDLMNNLGLPLPDKIQEALQPNQSAIDDAPMDFPTLAQLDQVRQLDGGDLMNRIRRGQAPLIIDVRQEHEFHGELGHVAGSRLVPLRELPARSSELLEFIDKDIVTVCRVGVRSTTAAAILTALGYERVWNLKGGMLGWNDAGLPVEH